MTRERVREAEDDGEVEQQVPRIVNGGSVSNVEEARERLLSRHEQGESVIQPPGDSADSLGDAIRAEIRERR